MANVIVFPLATRDAVRGRSAISPISAIEPIPLLDGTYYVGTEVLTDPAFVGAKYQPLALVIPVDFTTLALLLSPAPVRGGVVVGP